MVQLQLLPVAALFVFTLEVFHTVGHIMVTSGTRLLPRKDMSRLRYYFLVELLTDLAAILLCGRFLWVAGIHVAIHGFYVITWEKSYLAKRIVDWSSLDWLELCGKAGLLVSRVLSQMDSFLTTFFDISVHMLHVYALASTYLDMTDVILVAIVTPMLLSLVVFNPKFAWSHPKSMPAWVQRRLGNLALEY